MRIFNLKDSLQYISRFSKGVFEITSYHTLCDRLLMVQEASQSVLRSDPDTLSLPSSLIFSYAEHNLDIMYCSYRSITGCKLMKTCTFISLKKEK